jgi:hypothetical protein
MPGRLNTFLATLHAKSWDEDHSAERAHRAIVQPGY